MPSPNPNSAVRESALYGHACAGCSKAKCRCIGRGPGISCERCHRLSKDCQPSGVVRKRLARRPANKTARLEEKLDDLVTLLKTQATTSTSDTTAGSTGSQNEQVVVNSETRPAIGAWEYPQQSQLNGAVPPLHTAAGSGTLPAASSIFATPNWINPLYSSELSLTQAEGYLGTFRRYHLDAYPFVYIPPEVT